MPTPRDKPIQTFPTPNLRDAYFVEFLSVQSNRFKELEYGDLYPDQTRFPGARLTYKTRIETKDGMDDEARLVWCSARSAQDVYNAHVTFEQGNISYPVYTRSYLTLRSQPITGATKLAALQSLVDLELVSGGKDYTGDSANHIDLVFTGGAGTGAAGFGVVDNGVIVAVHLTNGGSGYTSAPAVSALVGSGLNVTAILQPTSAVLTKEEIKPADGEMASIWMQIGRVYETLPGPEIAEPIFLPMEGTGRNPVYCHTIKYSQRVAITTPANPIPSLNITGVTADNPAVITVEAAHGLPVNSTFPIRIAGLTGAAGSLTDGDYTATSTGTTTLTVPVHTTAATTANTGYLAWLKAGNIIINSYIKPDDGDGSVTGTLFTDTVVLPRTLTGKIVTKENGGAVLVQSRTVQSNRTTPVSGALVVESSQIELGNGMFIVLSEVNPDSEWPIRFGSHPDPNLGIVVDISRQAVDAGTLGEVRTGGAAQSIATILPTNPGTLVFATPHYSWPGDTVTIAGVIGGTAINGSHVVTPISSLEVTIPVNIMSAGAAGTMTNANTQDIYVEVQPVDYVSIRIASRLRQSTVLGDATPVNYPITIQFKKPGVYSGENVVVEGHDQGLEYNFTPGEHGEFAGIATEYYMTKTQVLAFIAAYPNITRFLPGGSRLFTEVDSFGNGRVWTFHVPVSDAIISGDAGPSGGKIISIRGENLRLGLYRVIVSAILGF